jgi:hypothetical protein
MFRVAISSTHKIQPVVGFARHLNHITDSPHRFRSRCAKLATDSRLLESAEWYGRVVRKAGDQHTARVDACRDPAQMEVALRTVCSATTVEYRFLSSDTVSFTKPRSTIIEKRLQEQVASHADYAL